MRAAGPPLKPRNPPPPHKNAIHSPAISKVTKVTGTPDFANDPNEILIPHPAACSTTMIPARLPKIIRLLENPVPNAIAAPNDCALLSGCRYGESSMVVVNFAYGMPSKPFIQTILHHGLSLPKAPKGDQVWQHSETAQQRVDADSNWSRQTDGRIQDFSADREVQALDNQEHYQSHTQEVDDHSKETVGGVKTIEAMGAVKLLAGGSMSVAAVDDLHQATGRDLNLVVGDKYNATVGGDMQELIEGLRKSVAGEGQRLVAPKNWIGSESVNLFQVVCDLLDLLQKMNTQLANHTHGPTPVPSSADVFTNSSIEAQEMLARIMSITL